MPKKEKYNKILDALQGLLESKEICSISVSEIAQKAGIGKGSVYYYFSSKEDILEALVERNYKKPIETAKNLTKQTDVSPFTRMAMIFQACRNSSSAFSAKNSLPSLSNTNEQALLHQKYISHLVSELKPELTKIIEQGIETGDIHFEYPSALAEIVLIILSVKLDNTIVPSTSQEIEETILGLIALLEKGTDNPKGSLNFLTEYT
ncbi:MAG: TetR/AcrR family transcriptional regulator [Eubacterium sp.]